ncbi:MAG: DoxX family protein [Acidimicrobiales bacterium]
MTQPTHDLSPPTESAARRKLRQRVGSGLLGMGVLHVVVRKPFEKIVPKALGAPAFWNLVAAAAEATAGGLLLTNDPKKRQLGGKLATATIVGVYPANIEMAIRAGAPTNLAAIGAWGRLPLQIPMIRSAWALARPEA